MMNVESFAEMFLTEARLSQGVHEVCNNEVTATLKSQFVEWILKDVHKESSAELAASHLQWEEVSFPLSIDSSYSS